MSLFDLEGKVGLNTKGYELGIKRAMKSAKELGRNIGHGLKVSAGVGATAIGAAATGIATLTGASVKQYAQYEQLVGGVDTLFNKTKMSWSEYADQLHKAGKMTSENAEEQYAAYEKLAKGSYIVQENAAKAFKTVGLSANQYMETVTGFSAALIQSLGGDTEKAAKYSDMALTDMSDNANKMGTSMESIRYAYMGFSKQNFTMLDNLKLGYGGTKAEMERLLEDAQKLSGVKYDISSYADIVDAIHVVQTEMGITGTTAKEASETISGSVGMTKAAWSNLITGMADEEADLDLLVQNFVDSVGVTAENVLPRVEVALNGAGMLVDKLMPIIIAKVPQTVASYLPSILKSGVKIIKSLVKGIDKNQDDIVDAAFESIDTLTDGIGDMLPDIVVTGAKLIGKLAVGLVKAIPGLVSKIPKIVGAIVKGFKENSGEFKDIGVNIVKGLWDGLKSMGTWLHDKVTGFFGNTVKWAKDILGIHSPSRVFADQIGVNMAAGVGVGWDKGFEPVKESIDKSMDFKPHTVQFEAVGRASASGTTGGSADYLGQIVSILMSILSIMSSQPNGGSPADLASLARVINILLGRTNIEEARGLA